MLMRRANSTQYNLQESYSVKCGVGIAAIWIVRHWRRGDGRSRRIQCCRPSLRQTATVTPGCEQHLRRCPGRFRTIQIYPKDLPLLPQ